MSFYKTEFRRVSLVLLVIIALVMAACTQANKNTLSKDPGSPLDSAECSSPANDRSR